MLSTLDQYDMFGGNMVEKCADNYRALRKLGITVRKTTDVIIATFYIDKKVPPAKPPKMVPSLVDVIMSVIDAHVGITLAKPSPRASIRP